MDAYSNYNDTSFTLLSDKMSKEHATEIDDIKSTVHKLFVALHLEEHQTRKEKELMQKMELLKEELLPLEQVWKILNKFSPVEIDNQQVKS